VLAVGALAAPPLALGAGAGALPAPGGGAPVPAGLRSVEAVTLPKGADSANLEECVSSASQEGRAVTFAGEMSAIPGTARMEMRIDLLEHTADEAGYRRVTAPGLGVWRSSAPGVKTYRYLKQVTNLAAPASYRGSVRFRWENARGHQIATATLHTRACEQTPISAPTSPAGGSLN
jgi:hypothetical protein